MTINQNLILCYLSGQISEAQWQEHLKDAGLREEYENYKLSRFHFGGLQYAERDS